MLGDRGKRFLRAAERGLAGIARVDAALVRRAVHEVASAELGALIDQRAHDVDGTGARRVVACADRKPGGLQQQPVQAGDLYAGILGSTASSGDLRAAKPVRLVR